MAGCRDWQVQVVNECTGPVGLRKQLDTEPFLNGNYSSMPGLSSSQPFVCAPTFARHFRDKSVSQNQKSSKINTIWTTCDKRTV
jgi:hypothetical protein